MNRMKTVLLVMICGIFPLLTACSYHPYLHQFYKPKSDQLNADIEECKSHGFHYATTNKLCVQLAEQGIYVWQPAYDRCACCGIKPTIHHDYNRFPYARCRPNGK